MDGVDGLEGLEVLEGLDGVKQVREKRWVGLRILGKWWGTHGKREEALMTGLGEVRGWGGALERWSAGVVEWWSGGVTRSR